MVGEVGGGEDKIFGLEFESWIYFEETADERIVFFFLDAAGAVADFSAGCKQAGGLLQKFELFIREEVNCFFRDSQADVGSSCEDGGVGTGDIEEDAIERGD